MDPSIVLGWFAMAFMFLTGSIWSESNVKYGYVLIPFMAGVFGIIGWISAAYTVSIIPIILMMGVMSYLRTHLRLKFGVFGSGGGNMLYKIITYVIFLQFAIIVINGMAIFGTSTVLGSNPTNDFTTYSIESAEATYGSTTTGLNWYDSGWMALGFVWTQWSVLWNIVFGFFNIYGTMVNIFHVPILIATVISAGIYFLTALEVFVLLFKPFRAPEP